MSSASMRTMSGRSPRTARRNLGSAFAKEWNEVVLAEALEHEEGGRAFPGVGDEVRPARRHRVGFARLQRHVLLRILHEDADRSLQHVERVLHVVVVMPGHLLGLRELQLVDAETGALGVECPALDLVEMAGVLQRFHSILAWPLEYSASTLCHTPVPPPPPSLPSYCVRSPCPPRRRACLRTASATLRARRAG